MNIKGGIELQSFKNYKMVSIFLVFLLIFSLVAPPLQLIGYADAEVTEEQDTTEEVSIDEVENEEHSSDEVPEEVELIEEPTEQPDSTVEDESIEKEEIIVEDENIEKEEVIVEETSDEESENLEPDYSNFELDVNVVATTSNSITIEWSTNHDIAEDFKLLLNDDSVATVPGDKRSHTFTDLNLGEEYEIAILPKLNNVYSYSHHIWETAYWSDDELVPVSIITMLNDDPYNEQIRIRGLDESNKAFNSNDWISNTDGDLRLPLGKFDVTIYDYNDPSIAAVETIEIKEGIDYLNNPIQLKFKLKEMREEAEPFHFEVTDVTENSYSLKWNEVSKITGFEISAWNYKNGYHNVESGLIDKNMTEYTFTGLNPDLIYSISLVGNYVYDLDYTNYFNLKTLGEDAKAPKVNFENDILHNKVASELGVFFRDVTEADMDDLTSISVDYSKLDSLNGIQYAHNLEYLYAYNNQITNIDNLKDLSELGSLNLGYNKVSNISALKNLNQLNQLELYSNEITSIDALANLLELQYLHLGSNKIADISALKDLNKLNQLYLYSNEITNIDALANLSELDNLSLDTNKITDISALKGLTKLNNLNLYSNEITNIDALVNLSNLEQLQLDYNKIADISALKDLNKLTNLSLYSNEITDVEALANLSELERLYLEDNNITDITALKDLKSLIYLSLRSNKITDIASLAGLENLEHLDLDYNQITDITALKKLPRLQTVSLSGMEITDKETIQYLRNDGVEVYYDGDYGDWNDWDDEEADEEEDIIIDREEIIKSFPEEQGFVVSEDGKSISLDLNKQTASESFALTTEQTKMLIENNQTLNLVKDDVQATIPASSFGNSDEPVTIDINELKSDPNSFSSTYDFTIKQGTRTISQFEEGITLTFNVNSERAKDPNNLKVFYFNEETGEWENIGGTYQNGKVTVVTYHFSKFTVFQAVDMDSNDIVDVNDEETNPENDSEEPDAKEPEEEPSDSDEILEEDVDEKAPGDTKRQPSGSDEISEDDLVVQTPSDKTNNQSSGSEKATAAVNAETEGSESKNEVALGQNQTTTSETEVKKDSNESNKLPKTATSLYTVLLIGALFLITGLIFHLINRRKVQFN